MGEDVGVVNTGVVPLVAIGGSREEEMGGVIDGRQGEVLLRGAEEKLEGTSWVLGFNRAADVEEEAQKHHRHPVVIKQPIKGGGDPDVGRSQQICSQGGRRVNTHILVSAAASDWWTRNQSNSQ